MERIHAVIAAKVMAGAFCASLLAACYEYRSIDPATISGREVSVTLTDAGSASLGPLLGNGVIAVRGRAIALSASSLTLAVEASSLRNGDETLWNSESVTLPKDAIASTRERAADTRRSALLVLAIGGGALLLGAAFGLTDIGIFGGGGGGHGGGR